MSYVQDGKIYTRIEANEVVKNIADSSLTKELKIAEVRKLIDQVSIECAGDVTVLYSGSENGK